MDRLRSLLYFVAAAEGGSFSAAARKLDVSVAAVAKLVGALERELGLKLFERRANGLALSTGGAGYLDACRPALAMLAEADEQAKAVSSARPRGSVVVGTQPIIAQECLTAALPRFNALYPEIQIDLHCVLEVTEPRAAGVDVFLLLGWPQNTGDLVQRHIGATSFVVCAAPAYWKAHGMPEHPRELERHNCLTIRGNTGTLMDLWHFRRGDERASVDRARLARRRQPASRRGTRRRDRRRRRGEAARLAQAQGLPDRKRCAGRCADGLGSERGAAGQPALPAGGAPRAARAGVHRFRDATVQRHRAAARVARAGERAAALDDRPLRARVVDAFAQPRVAGRSAR